MAATLFWFSGVESGDISELNGQSSIGSPSVVTTPVRSGTYALKTPSSAAARINIRFSGAAQDVYYRCYLWTAGNPSVKTRIFDEIDPDDGSQEFKLYVKTDGNLEFDFNSTVEATGTTPVNLSAWNLIELHFVRSDTVGGMEVKLNGTVLFTVFNLDTNLGAGPPGTDAFISIGPRDGGGQDMFFDDMALGTGAYIGPGQCVAVQGKSGTPTYDAWTKTGAADSFGCWSQTPFDATKFCTDTSVGDKQTMLVDGTTLSAAVGAGATINGAFVACVGKCGSSTINMQLMHRIGGTDTFTANKLLSTVDKFVPNTTAGNGAVMEIFTDTLANLAAAEIGAQAENATIATQVEDVWLMVDFTPSNPSPSLTPGTGVLTLTGFSPLFAAPITITPPSGALGLAGNRPVIQYPLGLLILFKILDLTTVPLTILFSITEVPEPAPGLTITFDIIESVSTPLSVTFNIFTDVVERRLSDDIQGPVARVTLT